MAIFFKVWRLISLTKYNFDSFVLKFHWALNKSLVFHGFKGSLNQSDGYSTKS